MSHSINQISIIGLGLIGGSIAKATRKHFKNVQIIAWDTNRTSCRAAQRHGIIDRTARSPEVFHGSDIIFICVPLAQIASYIEQAAIIAPQAIITDVGSVKGTLAKELGNSFGKNVVLGHPMAGKQTSGWAASDAELFRNRSWIFCPRSVNALQSIRRLKTFVRKFGARPVEMTPREHDRRVALCSHLPQLMATALAELAASKNSKDSSLLTAAGPGFGDMTRLAESPFSLWQDILSANEKEIEKALDNYLKILTRYRKHIGKRTMKKSFEISTELKRDLL